MPKITLGVTLRGAGLFGETKKPPFRGASVSVRGLDPNNPNWRDFTFTVGLTTNGVVLILSD